MNYSEIKYFDIANGVGTRTTLFVSGCRHHCKGCFNEGTWPFEAGEAFTREVEDAIIKSLDPPYVAGLTLLGGEPLEPENQKALLPFLQRVRKAYPAGTTGASHKTIWLYTGFTWEALTGEDSTSRAATPLVRPLLGTLDVLVDGPFVLARKDLSLRFRGSSNQRLIDVPATLTKGSLTLWQDDPLFSSHSW